MTVPTTIPDLTSPICPHCHERTAVRRVVDPELAASHRCGACGVDFERAGV